MPYPFRFFDKEIAKLKGRVEEAAAAARLAEKGLSSDRPLEAIVLDIQSQYPYELNNRKPLAELLEHLPEKLRQWEVTEGMRNRSIRLPSRNESLLPYHSRFSRHR